MSSHLDHSGSATADPAEFDKGVRRLPQGDSAVLALGLMAIFLALGIVRVLHHAMYCDEVQAWLLVHGDHSIASVFSHLHYEGHPSLWFLMLDALDSMGGGLTAMQVLHVLIATTTIGVVAYLSPFTRWQKLLFAFGYFTFYEFTIISRNYAIGILLSFIACWQVGRRPMRLWVVAVLVLAMSQADFLTLMLGLGIAAAAMVETWAHDPANVRRNLMPLLAFALAIVVILAITFIEIRPAADSGYTSAWQTHFKPVIGMRVLSYLWRAYFPIPQPGLHFWNTNLLDRRLLLSAILGLAMGLLGIILTRQRPAALAMYLVSTGAILSFSYLKYPATSLVRHQGHLFVALMIAYWLSRTTSPWTSAQSDSRASDPAARPSPVVTLILIFQVLAALYASEMDYRNPFSQGKLAADFISAHFPSDLPIVADQDFPCESVAAYLHRPLYYAAAGRMGTFIRYDKLRNIPDAELETNLDQEIAKMVLQHPGGVLVLTSYALKPLPGVNEIWSTGPAIQQDESYHLYQATASPNATTGTP